MCLHLTGPPLPPTDLTTIHVTAKSVVLSWVPGLDGGYNHNESFSVKYRLKTEMEIKLYQDGIKDSKNDHITTKVSMIQADAEYVFQVTAHTLNGDSEPAVIVIKTRVMQICSKLFPQYITKMEIWSNS